MKVLPTPPTGDGGHQLKNNNTDNGGGHAAEHKMNPYSYKASKSHDVTTAIVSSGANSRCDVTKSVIGQKRVLLTVAQFNHRRSFTTDDVDIGLCKGSLLSINLIFINKYQIYV